MNVLRSASLHDPMPVSLSGVMLEAVTSNGGSSKRNPPDSALSNSRPLGPIGVWQLWQVISVSTRYLPRSIGVSARAPNAPATISAIAIAPKPNRFITSPPNQSPRPVQTEPVFHVECITRQA